MQITADTNLSEWTEEWIQEILEKDLGEYLFFDFKVWAKSSDANYQLKKTVCSFANTFGGFLIFGIKDKKAKSGWDRIEGVADTIDFSKELTEKISGSKVIPHVFFEGPNIILLCRKEKEFVIQVGGETKEKTDD